MCQNLRRKDNKIELLSTQIEEVLKENAGPSTTISDQMEDKLKGIYKQLESKVCKKSLSKIVEQNTKNIYSVNEDLNSKIVHIANNLSALSKEQVSINSQIEEHAQEMKYITVLSNQREEQNAINNESNTTEMVKLKKVIEEN